ncbi:hypothetical protein JHK84_051011 [Glycine max]|nr:hypothetical protein JHK84_051011 [Glycine max]
MSFVKIEMIYMMSWPGIFKDQLSTSSSDIRNRLEYGVELSWLEGLCRTYVFPTLQVEPDNVCPRVSQYAHVGTFGLYELRYGHELQSSDDDFAGTAPYYLGLLTARHVLPSYIFFRIVSQISFVIEWVKGDSDL